MVLRAVDGVVVAEMHIGGIRVDLQLLLCRDVTKVHVLAGGGNLADAQKFRFLIRLGGKAAGKHIAAGMLLGSKIHGYHVELQAGAALNEEHIIVIAKPHEILDIGLGLIVDFVVLLRTMADLQNGHAAFTEIQEFRLGLLQHRQRQHADENKAHHHNDEEHEEHIKDSLDCIF